MIKTLTKEFFIAFLLTAATWASVYFLTPSAPLNGPDTTAVFGLWFLCVVLPFWVSKRIGTRKKENP